MFATGCSACTWGNDGASVSSEPSEKYLFCGNAEWETRKLLSCCVSVQSLLHCCRSYGKEGEKVIRDVKLISNVAITLELLLWLHII